MTIKSQLFTFMTHMTNLTLTITTHMTQVWVINTCE